MSDKNQREEARVLIKKITEFNVSNNYYQKEQKEQIARDFRKLLFVDDITVRHFLEKWIDVTKQVARDYDLLGTDIEVDKAKEEQNPEEQDEEKDQTEEEQQKDKEENQEINQGQEAPTPDKEQSIETPKEENPKSSNMPENKIYESYINRANELMLDLLED